MIALLDLLDINPLRLVLITGHLNMHVVDLVVGIQLREVVVQISVAGFVGSDIQDHVSEGRILRHVVVVDSLLRRPHGLPK